MSSGKNESLQEELKYLKLDYQNLKSEMVKLKNDISYTFVFLEENLKRCSLKLDMSLVQRSTCKNCNGYGTIYLSGICDMGQGNECSFCHGKGYVFF